jgi:hypothetical protein
VTPRLAAIASILCVALFAFAFIAAPKSCEWGNTAYFFAGVAALIALFVLPLVMEKKASVGRRLLLSTGWVIGGVGIWVAGLAAANIQIMCRLF